MNMKVRNRLSILMAEKNIRSVSELHRMIESKKIVIGRKTLDRIYNNENTRIDLDTIATLCTVLECEVSDLYYLDKT